MDRFEKAGGGVTGPGPEEVPAEAPAEALAFNKALALETLRLPKIYEVGPEAARQAREEGKSAFGPLVFSGRAFERRVTGQSGPLRFRVIPPSGRARGVFLHLHGGGWVLGGAHHHDPMLERLADATGLMVVSTYYRLAPEHPYPAGPDDCEAAALWLSRNAGDCFGTELVAIGGESAGAHLALPPPKRPSRAEPVPGGSPHLRRIRPARHPLCAGGG